MRQDKIRIVGSMLLCGLLSFPTFAIEEFVGPFSNWKNVKTDYGAIGDGITNDAAAIQTGLNNIGDGKASPCLYFPAGTYKINTGLTITARGPNIVGEDPATTVILWGGGATTTANMLRTNGCRYMRITRLTFDGNTTGVRALNIDWNGTTGEYAGNSEFCDIVIKNAGSGLIAGLSGGAAAESRVLRCKFINITGDAFGTANYNALNWWLWYCTFEDCNIGAHNSAGGFSVYRCVFKRSKTCDIQINNTEKWGIRFNYSIGSKRFFQGAGGDGQSFQGNIILDPLNLPVISTAGGQAFLADNIIRGPATVSSSSPVEMYNGISIGNTFSKTQIWGNRVRSVDDVVVDRSTINPQEPVIPPTPPKVTRLIFEPTAKTGTAIQTAITNALTSNTAWPVVHIPRGDYTLTTGIIVPGKRQIQIIGDGWGDYGSGSRLLGTISNGPMFKLNPSSRASVTGLHIVNSSATGEDVQIYGADYPGSRVLGEFIHQLDGGLCPDKFRPFYVDSMDNAVVEVRGFNFMGATVRGGAKSKAGNVVSGRCQLIGNNSAHYNVTDGGSLRVADMYSEIQLVPSINLNNSGNFTMEGSMYKYTQNPTNPRVVINNFNGRVTFVSSCFLNMSPITISGDGTNTKALITLLIEQSGFTGSHVQNTSPNAKVVVLNCTPTTIANQGTGDDAFMRDMLKQARDPLFTDPMPALATSDSLATDVHLFSMVVGLRALHGLHIMGRGTPLPPPDAVKNRTLVYRSSGASTSRIFTTQGKLIKVCSQADVHAIKSRFVGLSRGIYVIQRDGAAVDMVQKMTIVNY